MKNNKNQVFTPNYIVGFMLDQVQYFEDNIKSKTIFEPSFGNGAFLTSIIERILEYSFKHNFTVDEIHSALNNVYGVEIDEYYYNITIQKLNDIVSKYGIKHEWLNLVCGNTLYYTPPIKFDVIVGNPPYQRILDIDLETRKHIEENYDFGFGNTDLYVVFWEYCLKNIKSDGKICFITPNSYFKNSSQRSFRKYLANTNCVKSIVDYCNVKVFNSVMTYTAITTINFGEMSKGTSYIMMKDELNKEYEVFVDLNDFGERPWVFTDYSSQDFLKKIERRQVKLKDLCDVQHGIATNCDKIYILNKQQFLGFEEEILRPVIKGSTLNLENYIIFPYQWDVFYSCFNPIPECVMCKKYPNIYKYFCANRIILEGRDMDKKEGVWYRYGRSQGIQNSNNKKIVLKNIISKKDKTCEIKEVDEQTLVYSGIYIVVKNDENYDLIKNILLSEEFCRYLLLVGKNMAGGYASINAKFVKEFGIEI